MYSFSPGIDLFAHFGGGAVGFALMMTGVITRGVNPAWISGSEVPQERRGSPTVAAVVVSIALVGSVVVALAIGRPWEIGKPPTFTGVQLADTGIRLEVPSGIAGAPVEKTEGRLRVFTLGSLMKEPMAIELIVSTWEQVVPPDQIEEVLQAEQKAIQDTPVSGARRDGDATIVTIGGRRFVSAAHQFDQVGLRTWIAIFGDREVILRIYSSPDRPTSWAGVEDKIVASLQAR